MLDKPVALKHIVRVRWKRLAEAPVRKILTAHLQQSFDTIQRETGGIESQWTMFSTSIAEAAALRCGCKVVGACGGVKTRTSMGR